MVGRRPRSASKPSGRFGWAATGGDPATPCVTNERPLSLAFCTEPIRNREAESDRVCAAWPCWRGRRSRVGSERQISSMLSRTRYGATSRCMILKAERSCDRRTRLGTCGCSLWRPWLDGGLMDIMDSNWSVGGGRSGQDLHAMRPCQGARPRSIAVGGRCGKAERKRQSVERGLTRAAKRSRTAAKRPSKDARGASTPQRGRDGTASVA